MFWQELVVNIAAEVLFWIGLGLIVFVFYLLPAQKRFQEFFGLGNEKEIDIYLSNLWDPDIDKQPWGEIIAGKELEAARTISGLFAGTSPTFPRLVEGLVDTIWFRGKFNAEIKVSPQTYIPDLARNMIVIGATTKNSVRRHFATESECGLLVKIKGEPDVAPRSVHDKPLKSGFIIERRTGQEAHRMPKNLGPAIIERIVISGRDSGSDKVVIMCVGITGDESKAATEYLARNWRELERKSRGKRCFARCLMFDDKGIKQHHFDIERSDS